MANSPRQRMLLPRGKASRKLVFSYGGGGGLLTIDRIGVFVVPEGLRVDFCEPVFLVCGL